MVVALVVLAVVAVVFLVVAVREDQDTFGRKWATTGLYSALQVLIPTRSRFSRAEFPVC